MHNLQQFATSVATSYVSYWVY